MPWPIFVFAGAVKVAAAHGASTAAAAKVAAGAAKGAGAIPKGVAAHKGSAHLPPGTTTIAKQIVKLARSGRDDDRDPDKDKR